MQYFQFTAVLRSLIVTRYVMLSLPNPVTPLSMFIVMLMLMLMQLLNTMIDFHCGIHVEDEFTSLMSLSSL